MLDNDESIKKKIKEFYKKRSGFVHAGEKIERNDEQELREYVLKVLPMYRNASIYKSTYNHKEIVAFFQSEEYKTDIVIRMFFSTMLSDLSFVDKREQIIENMNDLIKKYVLQK